ncbi:MAG: hypothetical protein PHQ43_12170 [Dehalococcoidales bacterium]|nr:hypothetical protein [Dehalococcoidales bacterium]
MTTGITVMSGELGDIFWDLAPWITYEPGYDLGCSIYVANPGDVEKEYTLMARLSREGVVISEEVLPVFGYTWFKVAPGDFIRLRGALRFDESDGELAILLVERETEEVTDSVVTLLVSPTSAGVLPPTWPGTGTSTGTSTDWSMMMAMMLPVIMIGTVAAATKSTSDEKKNEPVAAKEERKLLPEGRQEDAR